jgi:hypothetical protein
MLDNYLIDIINCAKAFEKIAKAKPIYLYHGTSADRLQSILSQGLIPSPKERAWQEDPHASWYKPSRQSLQGIYLTSNLMTAISSSSNARFGKKKHNTVLIIVGVQPQSLVMDEDDLSVDTLVYPGINLNESENLISQMYFGQIGSGAHPYRISEDKKFLNNAQKAYVQHAIEWIEYNLKSKKLHPDLKARLEHLLSEGFFSALNRKVAHISPDYYKRLWGDWAKNYNNPPKQPTIAEAEKAFKDYQDRLTRTLKTMAIPENLPDDKFRFAARTLEPIGYTKSNKIVAIFELLPSETRKYGDDLVQIYPKNESIPNEALEKLETDWRANVSKDNFNIIKK